MSAKPVVSLTDSLKSLIAFSSHAAGEYTGLTFLNPKYLQDQGPESFLTRIFPNKSTKSFISASAANKHQHTHDNSPLRAFEKIGEGQCGTIWSLTGLDLVLKVMKEDKTMQLWNDAEMHKRAEEAFQQVTIRLRQGIELPRYGQFINPSHDMFWKRNMKLFPTAIPETYALLSSRINPLPLPVRESIVDALAPKHVKANKQEFLAREENQHCLIRVYLGRREDRSPSRQFRLRNFDLTISEMEHLRLDTERYSTILARALAILHWKAGLDANDVEYVLGSSPMIMTAPTANDMRQLNPESHALIT
ncbi:MAG: hypothetical protein L6R40_001610 [Gallowayella cf. fulva]|nr:MAG: hypothetical protein L6R40_001610 [Xanthomendoza cf. fulva]